MRMSAQHRAGPVGGHREPGIPAPRGVRRSPGRSPGPCAARGDGNDLAAFAGDNEGPVPALDAKGLDVRAGGLGDPQPVEGQQGDRRVLASQAESGCDKQVAVQPSGSSSGGGPSRGRTSWRRVTRSRVAVGVAGGVAALQPDLVHAAAPEDIASRKNRWSKRMPPSWRRRVWPSTRRHHQDRTARPRRHTASW